MLDLGRTLLASVERNPGQLAVVDGDLRLSYEQWFDKIGRAAGAFGELGLKRGDHVLTMLQNRWQAATLHWACQLVGLIMTPINWRASTDNLDYCARDADARALFYESASEKVVAQAEAVRDLPCVFVGDDSKQSSFEQLMAASPAQGTPQAGAEDISLMLYTSGTTGRPKGVPRRHYQERAAALAHVAQNLYRYGERTLGVMPLYHTMGVRSLLSMALVDGLFVCQPRFNPEAAVAAMCDWQLTNLYLVPTLYHDLINCPAFSREAVATVRKIGYAGASMPEGLVKEVYEAFQPELFVNHYGSSEIYTFTINDNAYAKPRSAGRGGINQRIRVVRLETTSPDELTAVGEEGQIIADLASDEAFEGYWKRPDADAKSLHEGWYFTGDTGYWDEDGDLYVTGRVDDIIITGGENVSPAEIENTLSIHPGVDEIAVVGLPDARWGQRIVAFVKRRGEVTADELDAHCLENALARFKRPREYIFVTDIPKSPVGKILRRKILAGEYEPED